MSANSFIGRDRSLFGAETIARVRDVIEIPNPIPFAGVKVEKVRVSRYRSGFDITALLGSARQELAPFKPEQFKIFLLGAMAGLRRNEIDKLPWSAFHWNDGVIHTRPPAISAPRPMRLWATCWLIRNSWRSSVTIPDKPGASS